MSHPTPKILPNIRSSHDLRDLTVPQLEALAKELREELCSVLAVRSAHLASNLGVVELCLALHANFDFLRDRLIWDTGHQIYPHKLITGRYGQFHTIRTRNGLMGYPNPQESDYDLFMTGHAGCSISAALGLKSGDDLQDQENPRHSVAVIGDGAFPSGIVYEALNNAGGLKKPLIVILNDNEMSICPRVGGLADYLDRLRMNPFYTGLKSEVERVLAKVPLFGDPVERLMAQIKEAMKAGLHGGMLFEELGFRYIGPIDGHDIVLLNKYLRMVKELRQPVLLHVVTQKGHGFRPAEEDPVKFHTPPVFTCVEDEVVAMRQGGPQAYTNVASDAIASAMVGNPLVTVLTAAMCQGNKLEKVREQFPDRFFDVGICESHAVAFAAGQAKAGMRPIVDIYSTFLQRAYDQLFQEVSLQNLPVTFMLDRAGLTGPDGPTHHGTFDFAYLRVLPNFVVTAPGDALELAPMLNFALDHPGPVSLRYPKTATDSIEREVSPIRLGKAEVLEWGDDGCIIACGTTLYTCIEAAQALRESGYDIGVINARFIKPLDEETLLRAVEKCGFVITVEEAMLACGFGSALLEAANRSGLDTSHVRRLGIPDRYVEHGERPELLSDLGIDREGIIAVARECLEKYEPARRP